MKRTRKANRPEPVRRSVRKAAAKRVDPRLNALQRLTAFHTHSFISSQDATAILRPFGLKPRIEQREVNDGDPKGLHTRDGKRGWLRGVSVYLLSAQIADSLPDLPEGVEVHEGYVTERPGERDYSTKLGRGSMARAAWAYIAAVLRQEAK